MHEALDEVLRSCEGLFTLQPNQAAITSFFGAMWGRFEARDCSGRFRFFGRTIVSLRSRNLITPILKENDRRGNPIEIAQAMLRRQQAEAIISARRKIVRGAVDIVEMALAGLSENEIVRMDEDRKAAMVSNLLVVLCGESEVTPVVNAGLGHAA